jgi:hypothetical protein
MRKFLASASRELDHASRSLDPNIPAKVGELPAPPM